MKRILNSVIVIFLLLISTAFSFYDRGGSFDGRSVGKDNHPKMIAAEYELTMADLSTSESRAKSLPVGQWGPPEDATPAVHPKPVPSVEE